ncbi:MAG: hypothetical protein WA432_01580 [Candidatus Babeliaceae bacterium]
MRKTSLFLSFLCLISVTNIYGMGAGQAISRGITKTAALFSRTPITKTTFQSLTATFPKPKKTLIAQQIANTPEQQFEKVEMFTDTRNQVTGYSFVIKDMKNNSTIHSFFDTKLQFLGKGIQTPPNNDVIERTEVQSGTQKRGLLDNMIKSIQETEEKAEPESKLREFLIASSKKVFGLGQTPEAPRETGLTKYISLEHTIQELNPKKQGAELAKITEKPTEGTTEEEIHQKAKEQSKTIEKKVIEKTTENVSEPSEEEKEREKEKEEEEERQRIVKEAKAKEKEEEERQRIVKEAKAKEKEEEERKKQEEEELGKESSAILKAQAEEERKQKEEAEKKKLAEKEEAEKKKLEEEERKKQEEERKQQEEEKRIKEEEKVQAERKQAEEAHRQQEEEKRIKEEEKVQAERKQAEETLARPQKFLEKTMTETNIFKISLQRLVDELLLWTIYFQQ